METEFYTSGNIRVTNSRFIVDGDTYVVNGITSAKARKKKSFFAVLIAAIVVFFFMTDCDYNRWRRQSACGGISPEQFENQTLA